MELKKIIARHEALVKERQVYEDEWQDLGFFYMPSKSQPLRKISTGTPVSTELYTDTGRMSAQFLASGLYGYLTNPSSKWFALSVQDKDLMELSIVADYLKECEDIIFATLNASNFNSQVFDAYLHLAVYGHSVITVEEDLEYIVRFYNRPVEETFFVEDSAERVDTVHRAFKYTARQAFERWGKEAGAVVAKAMKANKYEEKIDFVHIVQPRHVRDPRKEDKFNMEYQSLYIEWSKKELISEGGYKTFPYLVSRFNKLSGDSYGYSPAKSILPTLRGMNRIKRDLLLGTNRGVQPPLVTDNDGIELPLDMSPDALNFKRSGYGDRNVIEQLLPQNANLPLGWQAYQEEKEEIRKAFFVDLFMMLTQLPKMTATEVVERTQEKMLILAPMLGRLSHELLDPAIKATYYRLAERGKLPERPNELPEDFTIEYTSPLAMAQRLSEDDNVMKFMEVVGGIAQMNPNSIGIIDTDKMIKNTAKRHNLIAIIKDEEQILQEREEQKQAQQMQQLQELAPAMKDIAGAGKEAGVEI